MSEKSRRAVACVFWITAFLAWTPKVSVEPTEPFRIPPRPHAIQMVGEGIVDIGDVAVGFELRPGDRLEKTQHGWRRTRMDASAMLLLQIPIDLNEDDTEALPGIGPALAERIARGRPYQNVDQVMRVRGVGPHTLHRIKPFVVTRPIRPQGEPGPSHWCTYAAACD